MVVYDPNDPYKSQSVDSFNAHCIKSDQCGNFILRYDIDDGNYPHISGRYWKVPTNLPQNRP